MTFKPRRWAMPLGLLLLAAALLFFAWTWWQGRDTLWRIVGTSCIPAAASGGTGRCAEVSIPRQDLESGHVVFKDRNGPLQYLLMPTRRVSGIEDPFLLSASAPDYWGEAWTARRWMEAAHGAPLPRDAVSITLNSAWGRSQNHLHLHVSCVREDLRAFLRSSPQGRSPSWAALPGGWQGHPYEVRRVVANSLDGQDLFRDTAREHPDDMGRQALAAIGNRLDGQDGFWLLRTRMDLSAAWLGSIEGDVQDHACAAAARGPGMS